MRETLPYPGNKTYEMNAKLIIEHRLLAQGIQTTPFSKVADVVKELISYGVSVDVIDPRADSAHLKHEYGFELIEKPSGNYDAVILAVNHSEYLELDEAYFKEICNPQAVIVDVNGIYRGRIRTLNYWSL